jgi:hypothetical protein
LRRGTRRPALAAAAALLACSFAPSHEGREGNTFPSALSDGDFWSLTERLSEANGSFVSRSGSPDNLLSNGNSISSVAAELATRVKAGGVYLGVGPEQNFTYIAAMRLGAFYVSNVERYLQRNGVWATFCANAASLPIDADSVFIRPGGRDSWFGSIARETGSCR